jgi:hypothetical protein
MKKVTLLLMAILFSILTVFGQTTPIKATATKSAIFCEKIGVDGKTGGSYTIAELQNCDWKITTVDTSYTVKEFKMALVPKDDTFKLTEYAINGNIIPEQYRNKILTHTRNIFLEYIKAADRKGESILVKPIAVRIQS